MGFLKKITGGGGGGLIGTALNPIGSVTGGIGSSFGVGGLGMNLLGGLFPGAPQVPGVNIPQWGQGDQQAMGELQKTQQGQFGQAQTDTNANYDQQQKMLQDVIDKSRSNFMNNITSGPQGQAFRGQFNNSGLLDSGAFNQGLGSAFAQEQQGTDQALMQQGLGRTNAIQELINSGLGNQIGLGQQGLQRRYGLEDAQTNATIGRDVANANLQQQYHQGNMNFLGGLLGSGMSLLSGGLPGMGGGGGGGGSQMPNPTSWRTGFSPQFGVVGSGQY